MTIIDKARGCLPPELQPSTPEKVIYVDASVESGKAIILMGVSGSGKSTVGARVAASLAVKFIDGDDLHPRVNIMKMASGLPLDDADRMPWLERVNDAAYSFQQKNEYGLIVCSALKRAYRDRIRSGNASILFLYLDGPYELILERLMRRSGHYMQERMLLSQFEALERPDDEPDVRMVDIRPPMEHVIAAIKDAVQDFMRPRAHQSAYDARASSS